MVDYNSLKIGDILIANDIGPTNRRGLKFIIVVHPNRTGKYVKCISLNNRYFGLEYNILGFEKNYDLDTTTSNIAPTKPKTRNITSINDLHIGMKVMLKHYVAIWANCQSGDIAIVTGIDTRNPHNHVFKVNTGNNRTCFIQHWEIVEDETIMTAYKHDPLLDINFKPPHVCSLDTFVNVGFQFDKWVCKDCDSNASPIHVKLLENKRSDMYKKSG